MCRFDKAYTALIENQRIVAVLGASTKSQVWSKKKRGRSLLIAHKPFIACRSHLISLVSAPHHSVLQSSNAKAGWYGHFTSLLLCLCLWSNISYLYLCLYLYFCCVEHLYNVYIYMNTYYPHNPKHLA